MGNQKQKWTVEEEKALVAGVDKHGPGKWRNILNDKEFGPLLTLRSNVDLKVPFSPPLSFYYFLYISWLTPRKILDFPRNLFCFFCM